MNLTHLLFSFDGRIRRTHYWLGLIGASVAFSVVFWVIMLATGGAATMGGRGAALAGMGLVGGLLMLVFFVAAIWIGLALQVKRWHDRDKPWPWVLINLIPIIGPLWVLVECGFLDGTPGPNRFGPSPKGLTGSAPAAAGLA